MIRINLLGVDRKAKKTLAFDEGQRLTLACSAILVAAALGIGWWYWSLNQTSAQLDADISAAQQEAARLQSVLAEVRQFEQRRAQLQQRVALIEQLRGGQSVPVQLLDHVSRSLPDMIWLTEMRQEASDLTIVGRSTTLISLSDFVGNLGKSSLLQKPIEIVGSQVESVPNAGGPQTASLDVINFTIKARVTGSDDAGRKGGPAAASPAGGAGASR